MSYLIFPQTEQGQTKVINLLNIVKDLKLLAFKDFADCGFYRPNYNHIISIYALKNNLKFDQYQINNLSFNLGSFLRWCDYKEIIDISELEKRNLRGLQLNTHRFKESCSIVDLNWTHKLGSFSIKNKEASYTLAGQKKVCITSVDDAYIFITPVK